MLSHDTDVSLFEARDRSTELAQHVSCQVSSLSDQRRWDATRLILPRIQEHSLSGGVNCFLSLSNSMILAKARRGLGTTLVDCA
jgi:hypothetical protein